MERAFQNMVRLLFVIKEPLIPFFFFFPNCPKMHEGATFQTFLCLPPTKDNHIPFILTLPLGFGAVVETL